MRNFAFAKYYIEKSTISKIFETSHKAKTWKIRNFFLSINIANCLRNAYSKNDTELKQGQNYDFYTCRI